MPWSSASYTAEFSAVLRVVIGVLPCSPCLLDLLERVEVGRRVRGGLPFPAVKRTRLVKEGRGVEPWFRLVVATVAAMPPSRRNILGSRCACPALATKSTRPSLRRLPVR